MRRLVPALVAVLVTSSPALALSSQECSVKYQAAKRDGSLGSRKWNEFRKAECGSTALEPATVPNPLNGGATAPAGVPAPRASRAEAAKADTSPPAAGGTAIYPKAIGAAHASETPGKARFKTCLDQYNANKASDGNGGMRWVEKGGGYYPTCNARLKG